MPFVDEWGGDLLKERSGDGHLYKDSWTVKKSEKGIFFGGGG